MQQKFFARACVYVTIAWCLSLINCRSQSVVSTTALDSLARTSLGESLSRDFNPAKTYVLYKDGHDSLSVTRPIRYVIFQVKNGNKELEGHYTNGYIKWLDNQKVEIKSVPEKAKEAKDLTPYIRQVIIYQ